MALSKPRLCNAYMYPLYPVMDCHTNSVNPGPGLGPNRVIFGFSENPVLDLDGSDSLRCTLSRQLNCPPHIISDESVIFQIYTDIIIEYV